MSAADSSIDVLVAGAGPAGAAVALGLARLGYIVLVVHAPRAFDACEGVSERTLAGLRDLGFRQALAGVEDPSPRNVVWNGSERAANAERLLRREEFDAGLLADLGAAGIELRAARLEGTRRDGESLHCTLSDGSHIAARFLVDARGRSAPRAGGSRLRGPECVALLQRWRHEGGAPGTRVFALRDGWAWLARGIDGLLYTQLCLASGDVPKRQGLDAFVRERLRALPDAAEWLWNAEPHGEAVARASTAILQEPLVEPGMLRVGDAAMAVDPLSGNGIFQALSGAGVAPAVINTLLREPEQAELAMRFYRERIEHLFLRFARIGRDFYRTESRWRAEPFWAERAAWPDAEPAHGTVAPHIVGFAPRPVVERGLIREREVVLTAEQPLGVWRVHGVEIAPLLRDLPVSGGSEELRRRIAAAAANPALERALLGWCGRHGLLDYRASF